jgi:chorismate dehydratase
MPAVRVAAVRYLNTAPLIEGLDKVEGLSVIPSVPATISGMVKGGQADLGLASIVDCVGLPGSADPGLTLIPAGMIGCDGPTLTVRLFSSVPLDQVREIHADTDSHTSIILAQVLLHKLHNIRPRIIDFDARERVASSSAGSAPLRELSDWPQTVLLIGDKVVTDHPPEGRYPHQLDLGEAWHNLTGLPFVYAMWMCRDDGWHASGSAEACPIATAAALLDRQRRRNQMRLNWIIEKRAPQARWPIDLARRYLGELLRFEVGEREHEAVTLFLREAAALGLLAARPAKWAKIDAPRELAHAH